MREIRWYWEESEPLPGMLADGVIDLSTCIIHQKLQMVYIIIIVDVFRIMLYHLDGLIFLIVVSLYLI